MEERRLTFRTLSKNATRVLVRDYDFLVAQYLKVLGSDVYGTVVATRDSIAPRFQVGNRVLKDAAKRAKT